MDLSLYHGSATTLKGELKVAGVSVMVEGVLNNVENMTIVDGGKYVPLQDILKIVFSITLNSAPMNCKNKIDFKLILRLDIS